MKSLWISIRKKRPPHDASNLLVTNNIHARDAYGNKSHVWLVGAVHADDGRYVAFAGDHKIHGVTHWRFALPEEARASAPQPEETGR